MGSEVIPGSFLLAQAVKLLPKEPPPMEAGEFGPAPGTSWYKLPLRIFSTVSFEGETAPEDSLLGGDLLRDELSWLYPFIVDICID